MSLKNMKKEELELLSYKDITNLILEEKGLQNTATLFKKIIKLLDLPESAFDEKVGDYFTSLSTDKRFIMLEDGKWDLRSRQSSDKLIKIVEEDDDEEEIEEENKEEEIEEQDDGYDTIDQDNDDDDLSDDDLKDLVILDEDELELEQ